MYTYSICVSVCVYEYKLNMHTDIYYVNKHFFWMQTA